MGSERPGMDCKHGDGNTVPAGIGNCGAGDCDTRADRADKGTVLRGRNGVDRFLFWTKDNTTKSATKSASKMNERDPSVVISWIGTISSFTLDTLSIWLPIVSAGLTIIYTSLKIYDFFDQRVKKKREQQQEIKPNEN